MTSCWSRIRCRCRADRRAGHAFGPRRRSTSRAGCRTCRCRARSGSPTRRPRRRRPQGRPCSTIRWQYLSLFRYACRNLSLCLGLGASHLFPAYLCSCRCCHCCSGHPCRGVQGLRHSSPRRLRLRSPLRSPRQCRRMRIRASSSGSGNAASASGSVATQLSAAESVSAALFATQSSRGDLNVRRHPERNRGCRGCGQ